MSRLIITIVGVCALLLAGTSLLWAKAHVPLNFAQICNKNGKVKNISGKKLQSMIDNGSCRLPACDFDNVFLAGNVCDNTDDNDDGFCDVPGSPPAIPADSAVGIRPACTNPY